jgi:hypothetical protein
MHRKDPDGSKTGSASVSFQVTQCKSSASGGSSGGDVPALWLCVSYRSISAPVLAAPFCTIWYVLDAPPGIVWSLFRVCADARVCVCVCVCVWLHVSE